MENLKAIYKDRPGHRLDNIKISLGEIKLDHDMIQLWTFVNTVMKLRIPK
jgi:hypothetical protein